MDSSQQLRQRFNDRFKTWEIDLPPAALVQSVVWLVVKDGWTIWTRFDTEDGREYLDYYAMHRMTSDRHERLYADGEQKDLPAMLEGYSYGPNATKVEREEAQAKYSAYNQEVRRLMEEKGFVMTKDIHGSAAVNTWLRTDPEAGKGL